MDVGGVNQYASTVLQGTLQACRYFDRYKTTAYTDNPEQLEKEYTDLLVWCRNPPVEPVKTNVPWAKSILSVVSVISAAMVVAHFFIPGPIDAMIYAGLEAIKLIVAFLGG